MKYKLIQSKKLTENNLEHIDKIMDEIGRQIHNQQTTQDMQSSVKSMQVAISDLNAEVKVLRTEIQELKPRISNIETSKTNKP